MSNRKKWKWIFSIFVVVVIVGIAIALVLINKNKEEKSYNDITTPITTETYAASFSLNLPETIQILVGSKVNFTHGYVNVTPSSMLNKLTYEVTSKSSGVVNGIEFENNTITASSIGNYTIKFKMPKSSSTYFSKTINIVVFEENVNSHICQTNKIMTIGESINVSEIFSILEGKTYNVSTDGNTTYTNNKIIAQNVGNSKITFTFNEGYIEYIYEFDITIKDEPMFEIILLDIEENTININLNENEISFINFNVRNREEDNVEQAVIAISSNEDIVIIESIMDDVLIKIKALEAGEAIVTIKLVLDESVKVNVRIIVS